MWAGASWSFCVVVVVLCCGGGWVVSHVVGRPTELQELNYLLVMVASELAPPLGDVKSLGDRDPCLHVV